MSIDAVFTVVGLVLGVVAIGYLVVAILQPERFS